MITGTGGRFAKPTERSVFTFLSNQGWDANKEKIKAAFKDTGRGTWDEFERRAEEHFVDIYNKSVKHLMKLTMDAQAYKAVIEKKAKNSLKAQRR